MTLSIGLQHDSLFMTINELLMSCSTRSLIVGGKLRLNERPSFQLFRIWNFLSECIKNLILGDFSPIRCANELVGYSGMVATIWGCRRCVGGLFLKKTTSF